MKFSLLLVAALLTVSVLALPEVHVEDDFSDPSLQEDVLQDQLDSDDMSEDDMEEDELDEENPEGDKVDVHVYLPVPAGAEEVKKFPKWPGDKTGSAGSADENGDFLSNSIGTFQKKVASIVKRLKAEKVDLDKEDQHLDAHLGAIMDKINKAKAELAQIAKEDADARLAAIAAARAKALRDKMRSHPILSKLYTARKFVIELKRMVRALRTMDPDSAQYAETMGQLQQKMAEAKADGGSGLADIDEMLAVGDISDIEMEKVRDDEVAGLNGVLCAMMKHIQGKINMWEAKIRADHARELGASALTRDERIAAANKAIRDGEAALAHYKATMKEKHDQIKAKLRAINAELTQLGAIDGHVTKYRRTAVANAEANPAAGVVAVDEHDEENDW